MVFVLLMMMSARSYTSLPLMLSRPCGHEHPSMCIRFVLWGANCVCHLCHFFEGVMVFVLMMMMSACSYTPLPLMLLCPCGQEHPSMCIRFVLRGANYVCHLCHCALLSVSATQRVSWTGMRPLVCWRCGGAMQVTGACFCLCPHAILGAPICIWFEQLECSVLVL